MATTEESTFNERGLLFSVYASGHLYVFLWCLARWFMYNDSAFMCIPLALVSLGGAIDNYRLLKGAVIGKSGMSMSLTTVTYLFHMAGLPLLWITISDIIGTMFDQNWISVIGRVLGITLCVYGFNELMIDVMGNYVPTDEAGVWRYKLEPSKVSNHAFTKSF